MTSLRCPEFLLCVLLLRHARGQEPEPMFRAQGGIIEMGYCFGVDYIVVYRSAPEGDQLLGNSSTDSGSTSPPADLRGRVHLSLNHELLGLQITELTRLDSGIYRRECWQNHTRVSQLTQQLSVCNEEVEPEEISLKEDAAGAELLCNSTSVGLEGATVRWYYESYPYYKPTLFLDSSVSLEPLAEDLQGAVQVRGRGASLMLDKSVFKNTQRFHCLVIRGKNCLSFQNIYLPSHPESSEIFASPGDTVVLKCPSDGHNQQWETPLGRINDSSVRDMQLSASDDSEDFSLVIPTVTEDHAGDYTCSSSSLERQYSLVLCPTKKSEEKSHFEGGDFLLECKLGQDDSHKVQWYRTETSGEYKLLYDSKGNPAPNLQDLKGRVSGNGSSLVISGAGAKDAGVYWCVVLGGPEFLEHGADYEYNYDGEDAEDDEPDVDRFWLATKRCLAKQETTLTLVKASNITAYGAGAGVVVVLLLVVVVGVTVAVMATKKRRATSRSDLNTDIKMNKDPSCTRRLTSDESAFVK